MHFPECGNCRWNPYDSGEMGTPAGRAVLLDTGVGTVVGKGDELWDGRVGTVVGEGDEFWRGRGDAVVGEGDELWDEGVGPITLTATKAFNLPTVAVTVV